MRAKHYLDTDVLTAARQRIHHAYDLFDSVVVCFSGGKDSLTVLSLAWEVAQERGLTEVDVLFLDEELVSDEVIDFVDEYRRKPWVRMNWFAVPLKSQKFILGQSLGYVEWDTSRRHVRQKPAWAITPEVDHPLDLIEFQAMLHRWYPGGIGMLVGVRAAESPRRYRSCVEKLNENWICRLRWNDNKVLPHMRQCKPIYDWELDDVFRFFYERDIRYSPIYDLQNLSGSPLRVSTPLHAESAKFLHKLRATLPDFYARLIEVFPEMMVQERYWREFDSEAVVERYATGTDGVRRYIEDRIGDEEQRGLAMATLSDVEPRMLAAPELYSAEYVLRQIMNGHVDKRVVASVGGH